MEMECNKHYLGILRQDNKKYLSLQETSALCIKGIAGLGINSLWFLHGFHTKGRVYQDVPHFSRSGNREYFTVDNIKFQNLEYAMQYLLITSLVNESKITDDKIKKIRNIIQSNSNVSFQFKGFIASFKLHNDDIVGVYIRYKDYRLHYNKTPQDKLTGFFRYKIRSGDFNDEDLTKYRDEILEIDELAKNLKLRDNFIEFSWIAEEWFFEVVKIFEELGRGFRYEMPISILGKSALLDDIKSMNETEKLFVKLSFYKEKIDAVVDWKRLATSFDKFKECNNKVCHCKKMCKLMPLDCLSHYGCVPFSFDGKDGCTKDKKSKFVFNDLEEYKQKELIDKHKTESNAQFHLDKKRIKQAKEEFNEVIDRITKYWNFKKFFINEVLDNNSGKGCYIVLNKVQKKIIACDVKSIVFGLSFHKIYGSFIILNNGKEEILSESYYEIECDREEIIKIINGDSDNEKNVIEVDSIKLDKEINNYIEQYYARHYESNQKIFLNKEDLANEVSLAVFKKYPKIKIAKQTIKDIGLNVRKQLGIKQGRPKGRGSAHNGYHLKSS